MLPVPPVQAADDEAFRTLTALRDGPRGAWAVKDANLPFPQAASTFSCALDVNISEQATPNLNLLLRRTLTEIAPERADALRSVAGRAFAILRGPTFPSRALDHATENPPLEPFAGL